MQEFQAQAISQMGEGTRDYNRGVLRALGHGALFDDWYSACIGLELAVSTRDEAEKAANGGRDLEGWEYPEIDPAIHAEVKAQSARRQAAWAPIQRLKDEAQALLDRIRPDGHASSRLIIRSRRQEKHMPTTTSLDSARAARRTSLMPAAKKMVRGGRAGVARHARWIAARRIARCSAALCRERCARLRR